MVSDMFGECVPEGAGITGEKAVGWNVMVEQIGGGERSLDREPVEVLEERGEVEVGEQVASRLLLKFM